MDEGFELAGVPDLSQEISEKGKTLCVVDRALARAAPRIDMQDGHATV